MEKIDKKNTHTPQEMAAQNDSLRGKDNARKKEMVGKQYRYLYQIGRKEQSSLVIYWSEVLTSKYR